jgi:hypothetical protein
MLPLFKAFVYLACSVGNRVSGGEAVPKLSLGTRALKLPYLICLSFLTTAHYAHCSDAVGGRRAQAEGVVIREFAKGYANNKLIVLDLPFDEVQRIGQATPELRNKLISQKEFIARYKSWKNAPDGADEITIQVVSMGPKTAVVLAGTPFISLSGSTDRFSLKWRSGHWIITKRQRGYEIA